jgi:hypothetical protein
MLRADEAEDACKRQAATTAPSPRRCVKFVLFSTYSWQVFGLCRLPTCSGFPAYWPVP